MKHFRVKILIGLFAVLSLSGFSCLNWQSIGGLFGGLVSPPQPCAQPITYSIGALDPRFGLTDAKILADIQRAEAIWESSVNKNLFEYSPTGDLTINFVYDYRQEATDAMRKIGIVINDDKTTYDTLRARYDSLIASYKKEKTKVDNLIAVYKADKAAFEKDVDYWNSRGGAPKAEYKALEQRRIDLNNQVAIINQAEDTLNGLVDTINSAEVVLNKMVAALNLKVNSYNAIGSSTGRQFNEGEYVSNASGTTINIFQFNNTDQLIEVLAHELGHALGLAHLDNPKAIMYYINEGINEKITADDLAALKKACGIK